MEVWRLRDEGYLQYRARFKLAWRDRSYLVGTFAERLSPAEKSILPTPLSVRYLHWAPEAFADGSRVVL
jgi:hypothetical protein